MLTCYVRNNFPNGAKSFSVLFVLFIPVLYILFSLVAFFRIFLNSKVSRSTPFHKTLMGYLFYSIIYFVCYLPPVILYLKSANEHIKKGSTNAWFSFFSALCTVLVNLFLTIWRLIQGYGNSREVDPSDQLLSSLYLHSHIENEYKKFTNSVRYINYTTLIF